MLINAPLLDSLTSLISFNPQDYAKEFLAWEACDFMSISHHLRIGSFSRRYPLEIGDTEYEPDVISILQHIEDNRRKFRLEAYEAKVLTEDPR
jgi:hypothetical protein